MLQNKNDAKIEFTADKAQKMKYLLYGKDGKMAQGMWETAGADCSSTVTWASAEVSRSHCELQRAAMVQIPIKRALYERFNRKVDIAKDLQTSS